MCLTLYMATQAEQPVQSSPDLSIEELEQVDEPVRQWFTLPVVRFVGAHTQRRCGFPSIVAEELVPFWEGMFGAPSESREHRKDGRSAALRRLEPGRVRPPKGTIEPPTSNLQPLTSNL